MRAFLTVLTERLSTGTIKQLNKIINGLEGGDQQTVILRLRVLYESGLINRDVPFDDWLGMSTQENPSFRYPNTEQLLFFRGIKKTTWLFLVSRLFLHLHQRSLIQKVKAEFKMTMGTPTMTETNRRFVPDTTWDSIWKCNVCQGFVLKYLVK